MPCKWKLIAKIIKYTVRFSICNFSKLTAIADEIKSNKSKKKKEKDTQKWRLLTDKGVGGWKVQDHSVSIQLVFFWNFEI